MIPRTLEISTEVIAQEVSGETVLLDLKSEQYFSLDLVGTRVWQLLVEGATTDKVIETLREEYDVSEAQLRADIESLIASLLDAGLVAAASDRV